MEPEVDLMLSLMCFSHLKKSINKEEEHRLSLRMSEKRLLSGIRGP
jgi:hypothetical protein